jgi:hypothetical protein
MSVIISKHMKEIIKDIMCEFEVHRQQTHRNVIAIALWKHNPGYIPSLINGFLWWLRNLKKIWPGWGLRLYIDKNVMKRYREMSKRALDADWDVIIQQAKRKRNVELWFYSCPGALKSVDRRQGVSASRSGSHVGTFGSFVRYQALFDKSVDVAVVRNLEMLSSKYDAIHVNRFIADNKKKLMFYSFNYQAGGSNSLYMRMTKQFPKLFTENGKGKVMIPAGLMAYKGTLSYKDLDLFYNLDKEQKVPHGEVRNDVYKRSYGIDEIWLRHVFDRWMTVRNTRVVLLMDGYELSTKFMEMPYITTGLWYIAYRSAVRSLQKKLRNILPEYGDKIDFILKNKEIQEKIATDRLKFIRKPKLILNEPILEHKIRDIFRKDFPEEKADPSLVQKYDRLCSVASINHVNKGNDPYFNVIPDNIVYSTIEKLVDRGEQNEALKCQLAYNVIVLHTCATYGEVVPGFFLKHKKLNLSETDAIKRNRIHPNIIYDKSVFSSSSRSTSSRKSSVRSKKSVSSRRSTRSKKSLSK